MEIPDYTISTDLAVGVHEVYAIEKCRKKPPNPRSSSN